MCARLHVYCLWHTQKRGAVSSSSSWERSVRKAADGIFDFCDNILLDEVISEGKEDNQELAEEEEQDS